MKPQTWCLPAWCLEGSYICPVTYYLGLPLTRNSQWLTTWWISETRSITTTRRRPAMTAWPVLQDLRKGTKYGYTVQPKTQEYHPHSSHSGKASNRWSPDQQHGLLDPVSEYKGDRWWWHTCSECCHYLGTTHRTSSLKGEAKLWHHKFMNRDSVPPK